MVDPRKPPSFASGDWMLEQQMRAELEAQAWARLRESADATAPARRPSGDILDAASRLGLAAAAAGLAYLTGVDSQLGQFEVWLASAAAFATILALTLLGGARGLVRAVSALIRMCLIVAVVAAALWLFAASMGAAPSFATS